MDVKGTAFLGRRAMLAAEIGEARTAELLAEFCAKQPAFPKAVLATTAIPIQLFIEWNEMLVKRVYGGDESSYFRFGEKSAEWSLTQGPYKNLRESKSLERFAESGRLLYQNFYSEGYAETSLRDNAVDLRLRDIPRKAHHPYVELGIVGYFKRGLELVGARAVKARCVLGFTKGDAEVHYTYTLGKSLVEP
jgi:hypothetical protein